MSSLFLLSALNSPLVWVLVLLVFLDSFIWLTWLALSVLAELRSMEIASSTRRGSSISPCSTCNRSVLVEHKETMEEESSKTEKYPPQSNSSRISVHDRFPMFPTSLLSLILPPNPSFSLCLSLCLSLLFRPSLCNPALRCHRLPSLGDRFARRVCAWPLDSRAVQELHAHVGAEGQPRRKLQGKANFHPPRHPASIHSSIHPFMVHACSFFHDACSASFHF